MEEKYNRIDLTNICISVWVTKSHWRDYLKQLYKEDPNEDMSFCISQITELRHLRRKSLNKLFSK